MGCKPSKLQIQQNGDLYNEDTDVRKRFLVGIHAARGKDGVEGNFQIAFNTKRVKKYEKAGNAGTAIQNEQQIQEVIDDG